jgi:hypothetical protein
MHLSRTLMVATCLAALAAVSAQCFAAHSMPAPIRARSGSACQAAGQTEAKSLAFVVSRVEYRPAGEFVLTFENGEVWQQTDRNKKIGIERGEQVVIRRSKSGVFTLVSRGGESVRVKRMH